MHRFLASSLALSAMLWGLLAWAPQARAQSPIKPKIMIIFDTSGSMLSSNNDGSPLCSNSGTGSRVYKLKTALFETLQGIGATEIDFALATFPQHVDPTRTPVCPRGHYYTTSNQNSEDYSDSRSGCKISTHNPATQQNGNCGDASNPCSAWYPDYKEEVLKVGFGNAPEAVMIYFDQQEDTNTTAPLQNPEIRSFSWTPLGKSLFYAHGYLHKEVALPASSYLKKCERLVVALFTDGAESCNTSSSAFYPTKWATKLHAAPLNAVVHTVAIDSTASLLSQIPANGGGTYYNVNNSVNELKKAFLDIIAKSQPPSETCNGADDDCDNQVDEDFPQKGKVCDNGKLGVCYATGTYVCKADGSGVTCNASGSAAQTEVCNGLDDDCNGVVDDVPGGCTPCVPQPEVCNGKDDDCNGKIDDGLQSLACGTNVGECTTGVAKCIAGKLICDGAAGPVVELCDNKDNDCDGIIDGMVEQCYTFGSGCDPTTFVCQGQCAAGTRVCATGAWGQCQGEVGPSKEECDGVDNNCDGVVDENAECPGDSQCVEGQCTRPCAGSEFSCPAGQICKNGYCILDTCDPVACGQQNGICKGGECIDPCKNVNCAKHETCKLGACVDESCYAKGCPSGQICVQAKCIDDPCDPSEVSCGEAQFCQNGQCLDLCEALQCGPTEKCEVYDNGGSKATRCVDDPCAGVTCGSSHTCVDGKCVAEPCSGVICDKGEKCVTGTCEPDLCEATRCPVSYRCVEGSCVAGAVATSKVLATGAGGLACTVGDPAGASEAWPLGLLLLLGLIAIRRR